MEVPYHFIVLETTANNKNSKKRNSYRSKKLKVAYCELFSPFALRALFHFIQREYGISILL